MKVYIGSIPCTQVILQPSQPSWHNHQSRVIFCRIFFVANLVRCLLEIFSISTLSWTLRDVDSVSPLGPGCCRLTDKVSVLRQSPKPRIIFWFLKWETGIDTLLHHIGWIKCPSAHPHWVETRTFCDGMKSCRSSSEWSVVGKISLVILECVVLVHPQPAILSSVLESRAADEFKFYREFMFQASSLLVCPSWTCAYIRSWLVVPCAWRSQVSF